MAEGFTFQLTQPLLAGENLPGFGLLITHANRIPPHIGYCQNGIYYSLSNQAIPKPQDLKKVLSMLDRKRIPTLFVQLEEPVYRPSADSAGSLLLHAAPIQAGGSCLHPVRGMIEEYWKIQVEAPLIHGLLQKLSSEKLIRVTWYMHLGTANTHIRQFTIPSYDELAVQLHLRGYISAH